MRVQDCDMPSRHVSTYRNYNLSFFTSVERGSQIRSNPAQDCTFEVEKTGSWLPDLIAICSCSDYNHDQHAFKRISREIRADSALSELSRTKGQDSRDMKGEGGSTVWLQWQTTSDFKATSFANDKPAPADHTTPVKVEALRGWDLSPVCITAIVSAKQKIV